MRRQESRVVDVAVPVDLAVAQDLGVLESRDQSDHPPLLRITEASLEADQAPHSTVSVLLAQLDDRIGHGPGARVLEPDRLQGAEAKRILSAGGQHLDGEATLEERNPVPVVAIVDLSTNQRLVERVIALGGQGTVDVRLVLALSVA